MCKYRQPLKKNALEEHIFVQLNNALPLKTDYLVRLKKGFFHNFFIITPQTSHIKTN